MINIRLYSYDHSVYIVLDLKTTLFNLDGGSSTTDMTTPLLSSSTEIDRTNEPASSSNQKNVQQPGTSISNEAKLNDEDMNVATDAVLIDINDAVNEAQSSGPK